MFTRHIAIGLFILTASCASLPKVLAERPTRILWVSVKDATYEEFNEVKVAAIAWEKASRGALALPIIHGDAISSRDVIGMTFFQDVPISVKPTAGADCDTTTYRRIRIFRTHASYNMSCVVAHELGHALRGNPIHDSDGIMARMFTNCVVTPELASAVVNLSN